MDSKLLDLLVCPITHSKLHIDGEELVSAIGNIRYPIRDGLPVLLPDAAKLPEGATIDQLRSQARNSSANHPLRGPS